MITIDNKAMLHIFEANQKGEQDAIQRLMRHKRLNLPMGQGDFRLHLIV